MIYRVLSDQESFREISVEELFRAWESSGEAGRRHRMHGVPVLGKIGQRVCPVKITQMWKTGFKEVYMLTTESGKHIKSTLDHKFLTQDGWFKLEQIELNDTLFVTDFSTSEEDWDGTYPLYNDRVISIEKIGKEMTYDIEVREHHNFIANGIVTHNSHKIRVG